MKRIKISILCCLAFFLGVMLASCGSFGSTTPPVPISYSKTDIQNAASCWLQSFDISFGDWVGDRQCTALARLLTTAPGYGNDVNGSALGGYDYVLQQINRGIYIPLLAEVKNDLKPCDNLVLVGPGYVAAGHTVVVYYSDLVNDKIYYLDQNYNKQGVTLRQLSVRKNENNTYVIAAECKKPFTQNCSLVLGASDQKTQPSIGGEVGFSTENGIPAFANEMIAYVTLEYDIESNAIIPITEFYLMDLSDGRNICLTCQIPGHFPLDMSTDWYGSGLHPSWSPDHSMIAFSMIRLEEGLMDLYVADSEGYVKLLRTWKPNIYPFLFWSPDSQKVVIQDVTNEEQISLYIIDTVSGTEQGLPLKGISHGIEFPPFWQDNQITFVSGGRFYFLSLKDPEPRLLSNFAFEIPPDVAVSPSWSPAGDKLLLFGSPGEINGAGNTYHGAEQGLYVLERDGNIQSRLIVGSEDPTFPTWSPDGQKIAFRVESDVRFADDIYIVDLQTDSLTQLTDSPEQEYGPSWSPGGDKIAFIRDGSLVIMNRGGTNAEVLVPENVFFVYWR